MLLMEGKGITKGICHCNYRYANAKNKYMKDYDKSKESSYLEYLNVNNFSGWVVLQKIPVDNLDSME